MLNSYYNQIQFKFQMYGFLFEQFHFPDKMFTWVIVQTHYKVKKR